MIKAEIVAHSLSLQGDELMSVLCTFPRIILAEVNTHRMLSKNTSSSRAIPFEKMVEAVVNDPFIHIAWKKEHKGMQGTEYFTDKQEIYNKTANWLIAKNRAVESAIHLSESGVTKQLCNRLLEPFMWTTMLITGSREGWDNFFKLRCPQYEDQITCKIVKSRKEISPLNEYEEYPKYFDDTLGWLQINKGQAEIHMMMLSEKIYDVIQESVPIQLKENEWHIPMITDLERYKLSTNDQIKLSVGRAANTSYTVVGDGKELTLEQAINIHDKCKKLNHSSVFEHCARAMSEVEYTGSKKTGYSTIKKGQDDGKGYGWCNNLKGFIPYRYFIDNKNEL